MLLYLFQNKYVICIYLNKHDFSLRNVHAEFSRRPQAAALVERRTRSSVQRVSASPFCSEVTSVVKGLGPSSSKQNTRSKVCVQ